MSQMEMLGRVGEHRASRARVLIVDDQPVTVMVLYEALRPLYDVYMAVNGVGIVESVLSIRPDVILLDVILNDACGYKLCRDLQNNKATADIPVIFITAKSEEEDEAIGLKVGAVDYIRKPVNTIIALTRISTHVTLKLQADHLRSLASLDGLTGVHNRRAFDEMLLRSLAQSHRDKTTVSLIMLDVDFFKQFNDYYGHLEGDRCLKEVAGALERSSRRPFDFLARYGGEEFVCILPDTPFSGAVKVAEVMRASVEGLRIPHAKSDVSQWVSISLGVVAYDSQGGERSAATLLSRADEALYRAKQKGRNRFSD